MNLGRPRRSFRVFGRVPRLLPRPQESPPDWFSLDSLAASRYVDEAGLPLKENALMSSDEDVMSGSQGDAEKPVMEAYATVPEAC